MRYIPATDSDLEAMLKESGIRSMEELFAAVPAKLREKATLDIPAGLDEFSLKREMKSMSELNTHSGGAPTFLGAGTYNHFIPSVVNHLILRSEFYTAYTPYQPEISQGTLQAIFEFQTMVCQLTGMEVANASMYDGASALAEAVLMAGRIKKKAKKAFLSKTIHPEYREVVKTYTRDIDIEIVEIPYDEKGCTNLKWLSENIDNDTICIALQYPNFFGVVEDLEKISGLAKEKDIPFVTATTEPLSLGLLQPPGHFGADIAVAEGQSFGNAAAYGGPHLGMFAASEKFVRNMPGRIVGETTDQDGKRGYVLTLSTREQHIRREKATSNICSNQSLCALSATIYLSLLGKRGIRELALTNLSLAEYAKKRLSDISDLSLKFTSPTFNEFVIQSKEDPRFINERLSKEGIIGGLALERFYPELSDCMLLCTTEINTKEEIDRLVEVIGG